MQITKGKEMPAAGQRRRKEEGKNSTKLKAGNEEEKKWKSGRQNLRFYLVARACPSRFLSAGCCKYESVRWGPPVDREREYTLVGEPRPSGPRPGETVFPRYVFHDSMILMTDCVPRVRLTFFLSKSALMLQNTKIIGS